MKKTILLLVTLMIAASMFITTISVAMLTSEDSDNIPTFRGKYESASSDRIYLIG